MENEKSKRRPWTQGQLRWLKENYKKMPTKELARELGRTVGSVHTTVYLYLRGTRKIRVWTEKDIADLLALYGTMSVKQLAKKLRRTEDAIYEKVGKLKRSGVEFPHPPYTKKGRQCKTKRNSAC